MSFIVSDRTNLSLAWHNRLVYNFSIYENRKKGFLWTNRSQFHISDRFWTNRNIFRNSIRRHRIFQSLLIKHKELWKLIKSEFRKSLRRLSEKRGLRWKTGWKGAYRLPHAGWNRRKRNVPRKRKSRKKIMRRMQLRNTENRSVRPGKRLKKILKGIRFPSTATAEYGFLCLCRHFYRIICSLQLPGWLLP